ncbi:MAG: STM4014 family protein [Rubrivivax sp.]|nr:STM4014 family protein [Pyrinomonadaceae bacterium]
MWLSASERGHAHARRVVLIGVPNSRRTELFQAALARSGAPAAQVVSYTDLLGGRAFLPDIVLPGTLVRIDSPGKDFETELALLKAGADAEDEEGCYARAARDALDALKFERGRIHWPRQWYVGLRQTLRLIEKHLLSSHAHYLMNSPADIALMFDKPACHRRLCESGVPVPKCLGAVGSFDELREAMREQGCARVFVKLAHGSSASGVVAYQTDGVRHSATTTVEMVRRGGETLLYNSRRIRVQRDAREIAVLIDELCRHRAHVERWFPKAGIEGRTFDLRVMVIAGRAKHTVVRLSRHPLTNLHLLNGRGSPERVASRMGEAEWANCLHTCERMMKVAFPRSLYAGIDLAVAPDFRARSVLEVNAFGDLLPGVLHEGLDTYAAELSVAGLAPERLPAAIEAR